MTATTATSDKNQELLQRMVSVGAHVGYGRSRRHPKTMPYIYGSKDRREIFDLEKTIPLLEKAKEFVATLGEEGKMLLLVGGKPEAQAVVRQGAMTLDMPYVASRWIGGTLTNYPEVKKRILRLLDLKEQRERGDLSKYTKLERVMIDREIADLERRFGGLVTMKEGLPGALFIIDTAKEHIVAKEAEQLGIPVIGLMNSDCDPEGVQYPIVANDSAVASVTFFVNEIIAAYTEGVLRRGKNATEEKTTA